MYMNVSDFDSTEKSAMITIGRFGNRISIQEVLDLIREANDGSISREAILVLCALKVYKYATANSVLPKNMTNAQLKSAIEANVLL